MRRNHTFLIFVLALFCASFMTACESRDMGVEAAREEPRTADTGVSTAADEQAAMDLSKAHIHERFVAREAALKASNEDVKDFAEMLVDDHDEALEELVGIMTDKGIEQVEERPGEAMEQMQDLGELSGAEFDRKFVDMMVRNHEESVRKLHELQTTLRDEELREYVTDWIPTIEGHLEEARELRSQMATGATE